MNTSFAQKVEELALIAHENAHPNMASKAEVCNSIQKLVDTLWEMPEDKAIEYISASYSHDGHQALAVRMFKNQSV